MQHLHKCLTAYGFPHNSFAIERYNKNVSLQNRLLWEVKKFYPEEFKIGLYAVDTGSLECSRGGRNSWCSGEMLRYHEELRLRRQLTGLQLTLMLESVGIKQD